MKYLLLLSALAGNTLGLQAQQWELFPLNHKNYYELPVYASKTPIEIAHCDSIKTVGDTILLLFNSKQPANPCFSKEEILAQTWDYPQSGLQLHSGFVFNDTSFFFCRNVDNDSSYFKFLGSADVGNSWLAADPDIAFTCDSFSQMEIFGQLDSVKYFSINTQSSYPNLDTLQFILSKNHGLIQFAPFWGFFYGNLHNIQTIQQIGYESGAEKYGVTAPEFEDFFHLSTSDVLFWVYLDEDVMGGITKYYYKDSIVNAVYTPDSIVYEAQRFFHPSMESITSIFSKADYEVFLNTNTYSSLFANEVPWNYFSIGEESLLYWQTFDLQLKDSVFSRGYSWGGHVLDTFSCELGFAFDVGLSFQLNTRVGLSSYCTGGWGSICNKVIGAIINGVHWGNTNPLSVAERGENKHLKVYPNPFDDELFIDYSIPGGLDYTVFDLTGKVILQGILEKNSIDLSGLKPGFYYLHLTSDTAAFSAKIMKMTN